MRSEGQRPSKASAATGIAGRGWEGQEEKFWLRTQKLKTCTWFKKRKTILSYNLIWQLKSYGDHKLSFKSLKHLFQLLSCSMYSPREFSCHGKEKLLWFLRSHCIYTA